MDTYAKMVSRQSVNAKRIATALSKIEQAEKLLLTARNALAATGEAALREGVA